MNIIKSKSNPVFHAFLCLCIVFMFLATFSCGRQSNQLFAPSESEPTSTPGPGTTFTVTAPSAGEYEITFQHGSPSQVYSEIYINDKLVDNTSFWLASGGLDTMRSQVKLLPLESGNNVITIIKDDSKLKVTSANLGIKISVDISNFLKAQHVVIPSEVASAFAPLNANVWNHTPIAAADNAEGQYPLIIALHGAGGRGKPFTNLQWRSPVGEINKPGHEQYCKFKIFYPQWKDRDSIWTPEKCNKWLDHMLAYCYNVDETRIYLNGFSLGCKGSWIWANASKERFAAINPCSHSLDNSFIDNLLDVPIKAFRGSADSIANGMENTIQIMNDRGAVDADILIKEGAGHTQYALWNKYIDIIVPWLLSYDNQR
jgi:hypothetical protein